MSEIEFKKNVLTYDGQIICSNLKISRGENIENSDILMVYRYPNIRNSIVEITIPLSKATNKKYLYNILLDKGFPLDPQNKEMSDSICEYLSTYIPKKVILLSPQTGWYQSEKGEYCHVIPKKTFGFNKFPVKFINENPDTKYIGRFGSFENYQKALDLCKYSPPAILAVGASLAAFYIAPFGFETFGLHLYGRSSCGKTTIGSLAGATLCNPMQYITWKITEAGVEEACFNHNGRCIIFDEAKLISKNEAQIAATISDLSYFICSGKTKKRSFVYNVSTGSNVGAWHLVFISTGEFGIIENALSVGHDKDDGEKLRFIDVPAIMSNEYGVFEKLPKNYSSSKALIQDIQTLIKNNFGWLGYHYLSKMVHKLNSDKADEFRATVNEYIQDFESKCDLGCKQGYGQRFLHRFAIIYASLMMANKWKLVPWAKKRIFKSIQKMYAISLNCIRDNTTILKEGLNILKKTLVKSSENYVDLDELSSKDEILSEWENKKFFGKKQGKVFSWVIPSKVFKSWFLTQKQCTLVEEYLEDLIEKDGEGYALFNLGYKIRKRAIVLNKKKLKELLSE